jgi:hypothetical protein
MGRSKKGLIMGIGIEQNFLKSSGFNISATGKLKFF